MTPNQAELLSRYRRHIAALEEQASRLENHELKIFSDRDDITLEWAAQVRAQVADLQALVDKHDPEGLTNIEPAGA